MKEKIVIIGAGPAGLTAAYYLLKSTDRYDVVLLEKEKQVGGIAKTIDHNGNRMDLGGHRFFSKEKRVTDLWNEVLPMADGADCRAEGVMLERERVSRILFRGKFFDYPISMKWQTFANMGFGTSMAAGFSYLFSCVHKLPETSLENFYINRFGKVLYEMFFKDYTEKVWGRAPSAISADWGAQRVKGLSIKEILKEMILKIFGAASKHKETSLIESFLYPKYGPGQLWEKMEQQITEMGGTIRKEVSVEKVNLDSGRKINGLSVYDSQKGMSESIEGDIFISSMPLKDLVDGMSVKVPEDVKRIADGLPYRDFLTIGVLVKKLALKGNVPDCWMYIQDSRVKLGRIQIFNNWSPYMVKNPQDTVWIGMEYFCREGDEFWNMSDAEFAAFAGKELVKIGVINDSHEIMDYCRVKVPKAYPAYFDTYKDIDRLTDYLNTIDNLYCIGRNGQHRYNNMDHSMMTALEVADGILAGFVDREKVWNVNTEKAYHEEK